MSTLTHQVDSLERYIAEISRHPILSRLEEVDLAKRFRDNGDVDAARKLVVSNLRFVVKIAHGFKGYQVKILDLIQEGNIGLMVAVKKFNPDKGYRLISYAVWWIKAYMQNFIARSWSLVRLGSSRMQRKLFFRLRSERSKIQQAQQDSTAEEITKLVADTLSVDARHVAEMELRLAGYDFSLNTPIGDGAAGKQAITHMDMLCDNQKNQEDVLGDKQHEKLLKHDVKRAMLRLNKKEREIIKRRILNDDTQTLQDIGVQFKVSRERIRQLEKRALSKLKTNLGASYEGQL